ncbi:hypothetical protein TcCL_NonESM04258, partial [Trypanosoma cruzi]
IEQAQDVSMAVLRQLQRGVARLAHEAAGVKLSTTWGMPEAPDTHTLPQPQRWEDGYVVKSPASVGKPQVKFNTHIAIRAFFPFSVSQTEEEEGLSLRDSAPVINSFSSATVAADNSTDRGRRTGRRRRSMSTASLSSGGSFSSELAVSHKRSSRLQQPMSFKKLLVYTFGNAVVVH